MSKPPKRICGLKMCNNEGEFYCGRCEGVDYCCEEHQKQDWIAGHRKQCGNVTADILKQQLALHYKNRISKRKQYYGMFLAQKTDDLLYTARELEDIQMRIDAISKNQFDDQFQLAATICLHIKTLINLNERLAAKTKLQNYLAKNRIISETLRLPTKGKVTEESKKFLLNKLNLIATLANLSHNLQMSPVQLYTIYTQNIQLVFGKQSLQASNCFFMMGHYYYQQKHLVKAIACFRRAAQMRNQQGPYQCYVNMGICYKALKRNNKAIQMFLKALQRLTDTKNEYSNDAAELNEYLAITYMQQLNFLPGIKHLEVAYLIRNRQPQSAKCKQLHRLILFLYEYLDKYIQDGNIDIQKSEMFKYLKDNVFPLREQFEQQAAMSPIKKEEERSMIKQQQNQKSLLQQNLSKMGDAQDIEELGQNMLNIIVSTTLKEEIQTQTGMFGGDDYQNHKMKLPPGMINKLDAEQISYLAKLQLELQTCTSKYRIISAYNKSQFLGSLSEAQRKEFKQQNLITLRDMDIANPKQQQIQVQVQVDKKKGKHKKAPPLNLTNLQRNI